MQQRHQPSVVGCKLPVDIKLNSFRPSKWKSDITPSYRETTEAITGHGWDICMNSLPLINDQMSRRSREINEQTESKATKKLQHPKVLKGSWLHHVPIAMLLDLAELPRKFGTVVFDFLPCSIFCDNKVSEL